MEVTQFTYFQQMGGFDCKPVAGELTYGLERLAMYIQGVDRVYDLRFNNDGVSYGDVFLKNEQEMSKYNFEIADTDRSSRASPPPRLKRSAASRPIFRWPPMIRRSRPRISSTCFRRAA
jgi:hypothetical protein